MTWLVVAATLAWVLIAIVVKGGEAIGAAKSVVGRIAYPALLGAAFVIWVQHLAARGGDVPIEATWLGGALIVLFVASAYLHLKEYRELAGPTAVLALAVDVFEAVAMFFCLHALGLISGGKLDEHWVDVWLSLLALAWFADVMIRCGFRPWIFGIQLAWGIVCMLFHNQTIDFADFAMTQCLVVALYLIILLFPNLSGRTA